jgi:hypothetical protein
MWLKCKLVIVFVQRQSSLGEGCTPVSAHITTFCFLIIYNVTVTNLLGTNFNIHSMNL